MLPKRLVRSSLDEGVKQVETAQEKPVPRSSNANLSSLRLRTAGSYSQSVKSQEITAGAHEEERPREGRSKSQVLPTAHSRKAASEVLTAMGAGHATHS